MILNGGVRLENNFLNGVKISQLGDMTYTDEYTVAYGYPAYYNNKIYVDANTVAHSAFQVLNITTGNWSNLTKDGSSLICTGIVPYNNLIYGFFYGYPTTTNMTVKPYNPSNDTWGTGSTFAYTSASCASVCSSGNTAYVAYVYSLSGSTFTWHLFSYNISNNTKSSDLNFEIVTTDSVITHSLLYGSSTIFFISGNNIYEYNPSTNATSKIGTYSYVLRYWKNCVYYNGKIYIYSNYGGYGTGKITIFDTSTHTSTEIGINLPNNTYIMSTDPNGKLYCFGSVEVISGSYITNGHTYVIEP